MKNAAHSLIDFALAAGHTISVFDGEEWSLRRSTDRKMIIADMEGVDEAQLLIHSSEDIKDLVIGSANIINGLDNDEIVADYTCTPFMEAWSKHYNG